MSILKKIVEKVDAKADKVVAEKLAQADVEPAPKKQPPKAESVATPMGGGSCPLRLLEMAGFAGVVVATLVAAVAGRCRR